MIQVDAIIYRPLLVNTYIIHEKTYHEGIVIDPAGVFSSIKEIIDKYSINIKFILYTHLHLDHIAGGHEASGQLSVPSFANKNDLHLFDAIEQIAHFLNYPQVTPPHIDEYLNDNDELKIGDTPIIIRTTPGHTPGSCSFIIENTVFSGDTLFKDSVGRSDLPGGNQNDLFHSIRTKLYPLPDHYLVRPGHGGYTNIGYEKANNPFVKGT